MVEVAAILGVDILNLQLQQLNITVKKLHLKYSLTVSYVSIYEKNDLRL